MPLPRPLLLPLLVAAAAPLAAQEVGPALEVERVTLRPGESATFTLAPGFDHQLLRRAAPGAPGAITLNYEVEGGESRIVASGGDGRPLVFTILADPDGNGGFSPMGEMTLPGDGRAAERRWPGSLGAVNIGDFRGGPHGDHEHRPSGD